MPELTTAPSVIVTHGTYNEFCDEGQTRTIALGLLEGLFAPAAAVYYEQETLEFESVFLALEAALVGNAGEWRKFQSLVSSWRRERGAMSSITEVAVCPSYQSIIGMGAGAVPLILAQLESE